jgi:hypothetical protein
MTVLLKRFDPEENVNRWYMVHVQPTLFEPIAVICAWGSWETTWQQMRILPAGSLEEAQAAAEGIVAVQNLSGGTR